MRFLPLILLCAVVTGAVLCSACLSQPDPVYKPDVSTTELKVNYTGPIQAKYGTYDCIFNKEVMAPTEILFKMFNCRMDYASFGKVANDTGRSVLTADIIRDGQVIKSYSTSTSGVGFDKIPEFLVRSAKEPDLMQGTPLTAKIIVDGEWTGWFEDAFGTQYEYGSGSASLTILKPALPVKACVRSKGESAGTPPVVEIYRGGTFLKRSDSKNEYNNYCVTYP
ncbi:MAG: hypothetical protein WCH85_08500 [Methanomicrobiales archaeon]